MERGKEKFGPFYLSPLSLSLAFSTLLLRGCVTHPDSCGITYVILESYEIATVLVRVTFRAYQRIAGLAHVRANVVHT